MSLVPLITPIIGRVRALHRVFGAGNVHQAHNWEVADQAARLALGVTAADVGKLCLQTGGSDAGLWRLTSASPATWACLAGPGATWAWGGQAASAANQQTTPGASKSPLADADARLDPGWFASSAVDTSFFPSTTLVTAIQGSTKNDSGGGLWRKKCADKSWYNETIYGRQIGVGYYANEAAARAVSGATTNDYYYDTTAGLFKALNAGSGTTTIYRGGRREHPENYLTTYESGRIVRWDCDFGAPRMWKVFNATSGYSLHSGTISGAISHPHEGHKIYVPMSTQLIEIDFVADVARKRDATNLTTNTNNLANCNSAGTWGNAQTSGAIVNAAVNAVAITVLPNAPIDVATGLPKPTIAVATAGGVSVIKDDDTVVNSSVTTSVIDASITKTYDLVYGSIAAVQYGYRVVSLIGITASFSGRSYSQGTVPYSQLTKNSKAAGKNILGSGPVNYFEGLTIHRENPASSTKGLIAYITHTYNTGWLPGDIRRAWLADTVAETVTAATPLSDDFSSYADTAALGAAGWDITDAILDAQSVKLTSASGSKYTSKAFTTVAGKTYVITVQVTRTSGTFDVRSGTTSTGIQLGQAGWQSTSKTVVFCITATGTTSYVAFGVDTGSSNFDNISVKLAEPDRCVKNKAITVVGSLTKSAVASGANLVAYSGFGASNYLEEAYSFDLDFGTGDFCVMGWFLTSATAFSSRVDECFYSRGPAGGTSDGKTFNFSRQSGQDKIMLGIPGVINVVSPSGLSLNSWNHVVVFRRSGYVYFSINGVLSTGTAVSQDLSSATAISRIGSYVAGFSGASASGLSLFKVSATAPTAEQIKHIYETEKKLFEANAQCTLAGTSSAVLALDHDDTTDTASVMTTYGRSDIKGLVRVASEATPVGTPKAVSAHGGCIVQVGSTGADYYAPAKNLREEMSTDLGDKPRQLFDFDLSSATTCTLPMGWKPTGAVWAAGAKKREGAAKDFTITYDGFLWSVVMTASTTAWVQVEGEMQ